MHLHRILPQHLVAMAAAGLLLVCGASAVAKPAASAPVVAPEPLPAPAPVPET